MLLYWEEGMYGRFFGTHNTCIFYLIAMATIVYPAYLGWFATTHSTVCGIQICCYTINKVLWNLNNTISILRGRDVRKILWHTQYLWFLRYWNGHNTVCYILLMVCNYTLESMQHTDLLLYYQQSIVTSEIILFLHYWNSHNTVCCILGMVCNYTFQSRWHTDLLLYYQQGIVK